ncbi:MAG: hypothetical protein NY202_01135 [Mollicutes bacterium UO1]
MVLTTFILDNLEKKNKLCSDCLSFRDNLQKKLAKSNRYLLENLNLKANDLIHINTARIKEKNANS